MSFYCFWWVFCWPCLPQTFNPFVFVPWCITVSVVIPICWWRQMLRGIFWVWEFYYRFKSKIRHTRSNCEFCDEDWIEQGLTSPPTQYRLSGRQFYRSKDQTNSTKVLKEKLASHRPEEAPNPPGASHCVTSEHLKKEKPYHSGSSPARQSPTQQCKCVISCIQKSVE